MAVLNIFTNIIKRITYKMRRDEKAIQWLINSGRNELRDNEVLMLRQRVSAFKSSIKAVELEQENFSRVC